MGFLQAIVAILIFVVILLICVGIGAVVYIFVLGLFNIK